MTPTPLSTADPAPTPGFAGKILVVDDDDAIRDVISLYLADRGYLTESAADGLAALKAVQRDRFDLMILDLMLPGLDGFGVLADLRSRGSDLPVIVLSARGNDTERAMGLEHGADDYLAKPASPRELMARVGAVLRRSRPADAPTVVSGPFEFDLTRRSVSRIGEPIPMPRREYELFLQLARTPGRVHSRSELLEDVWGSSAEWQDPATVTVHVRRLRAKIEVDVSNPRHLVTVYGIGYRFES